MRYTVTFQYMQSIHNAQGRVIDKSIISSIYNFFVLRRFKICSNSYFELCN